VTDTDLKIHSIETFGTSDGPGIRLVVFTQGCLFRCVYCHNPDSQDLETPEMRDLALAELLKLLENQKPYFGNLGGLTFSGGEPTVQASKLLEYLPKIQAAGFNVALDTCGGVWTSVVNQLYDQVDLVILDVKHIDPVWHQKLTGQSNLTVLKNAAYREQTGKPMWLRYVLVPGWTDQPEFLHQWGKTFQTYKSVQRVEILPYHNLGVYKYHQLGRKYQLEGVEPPTIKQIKIAELIFRQYFKTVVVH